MLPTCWSRTISPTVRYMADDIVVMCLGRIVEHAPTKALFDDVRHPYTKALLSAVLPPRVGGERDEIVLTGEIPRRSIRRLAAGSTRAVLS
jgi:ABC-type oligopeptide transport system ATPase subunit